MNAEELIINEKNGRYAKVYASLLGSQYQRKRANAAISCLFAYIDYLKNNSYQDIKIQNSMTLYRVPFLCEHFELADFYINGYHIDVRITSNEQNVLLPKIHYDKKIVADFYIVIQINSLENKTKFVGVVDTNDVTPESFDENYLKVSAKEFITNEEFLNRIREYKVQIFTKEEHEKFQEDFLAFIDNELNMQKKVEILRHLFNCEECRTEFCCFTGFEMVSKNTAKYPEILNDETLNIIGAQCVDDDKYKG